MSRFTALVSSASSLWSKRAYATRLGFLGPGDAARRGVVVRLLPGHQPRSKIERHLRAVLANGPMPLDTLIDEVAEWLLLLDLRGGGWAADIGMLGPTMYRSEASATISSLNGLMVEIETPHSG